MRDRSSLWFACAGALLAALGCPSVAAPAIQFATAYQALPSVTTASWVRAVDFDRDGIPDLVVNGVSNSIWIHRGLPAGGYAPVAPLFTHTSNIATWESGDLNNDGILDLVVCDVSQTVSSVLGNANGTFQAPRAILSLFSGVVKLADLDGDGKLDVIAAQSPGPLFTMKGLGDGRFTITSSVTSPLPFPVDLTVADFDKDGKLDVMEIDAYSQALAYFHGLAGGLVAAPTTSTMPGAPTSIRVADLDEDGFPDAMIVNTGSYSANVAAIVYGAGGGAAFGRLDIPVTGLRTLNAYDLDGDGHLEIVAPVATIDGDHVTLLHRTATRAYASVASFAGGPSPQSAVFVDTDADGKNDIVVCSPPRSQLSVLHGHGGLNFGDGAMVHTVASASDVAIGDVNGDHTPDLVATKGSYGATTAGVHLGIGDGSFAPMSMTVGPVVCCGHQTAQLADFNGDDKLDLLGLSGFFDQLDVATGDGLGHFATGSSVATPSEPHGSLVIADFDEDGHPDVVVPTDLGIFLYRGAANGVLGTPIKLASQEKFVATADFDRDGHADLIATNSAYDYGFGSNISVFLGRGDGTFLALPDFYAGYQPMMFAVGEVNNDLVPDVAMAIDGEATVVIFTGRGDGTFTAGQSIPSLHVAALAFADLDLDGNQDLVATVRDYGGIRVWRGLGLGSFATTPLDFGTETLPGVLRVADLNHDNMPDLVVGHLNSDVVDVLMNRTPAPLVDVQTAGIEASRSPFIESCRWDPTGHVIRAKLSLAAGAPAQFQVLDVVGRPVGAQQEVPAGAPEWSIVLPARVASGVYWARLAQGGRSSVRRVVVLQ